MDTAKIEAALKLIEDQVAAIRSALGGGNQENPMVTPEKPAGENKGGMREFLGM